MQALQVQAYLSKANDFLNGMKFFADAQDQRFRYSSALLAIHSAISYGDALCVGLGGAATGPRDHRERVPKLQKLLNERKHSAQHGLKHFENLLRDKSNVAYASKNITEKQAKAMADHAQKFSTWANTTGIDLKIEGWRDAEFN
jgi:hypothetical protein